MMRNMIVVAGAMAIVMAIVGTDRARAAVGQEGLTPVPCASRAWACASRAWESDDPTFQALPGAKALFGKYDGGVYRIEIPDNWNGDLVLWAHGYVDDSGPQGLHVRVGFPTGGQTGAGPTFREHLIARGFAWAASSYRCNGYVPGAGLLDTIALGDVFTKANGGKAAARTYLSGVSMGGHVTLLGMAASSAR